MKKQNQIRHLMEPDGEHASYDFTGALKLSAAFRRAFGSQAETIAKQARKLLLSEVKPVDFLQKFQYRGVDFFLKSPFLNGTTPDDYIGFKEFYVRVYLGSEEA